MFKHETPLSHRASENRLSVASSYHYETNYDEIICIRPMLDRDRPLQTAAMLEIPTDEHVWRMFDLSDVLYAKIRAGKATTASPDDEDT